MSDRIWQTLEIGGDPGIHRAELHDLLDEFAWENCIEEEDGFVCDGECRVGCDQLDAIKKFLREHGLSYNHRNEAKWDYDGEIWYWRPGLNDDGETESYVYCRQDGTPTITYEQLVWCDEQGMSLQEAIDSTGLPELPQWVCEIAQEEE